MPVAKADRIIVDREFVAKTAEDVFLKYRADIIEDLRQRLIVADKDQPGELLQSINGIISIESNKITLQVEMEDYWKYVDAGRRPGAKQPPQKSILEFIKNRGIKPKKPKQIVGVKNKKIKKALKQISRDKALKQVAFAIGKSIKKKGIKPTNFFKNVINEDLRIRMQSDLSIALKTDIELQFTT